MQLSIWHRFTSKLRHLLSTQDERANFLSHDISMQGVAEAEHLTWLGTCDLPRLTSTRDHPPFLDVWSRKGINCNWTNEKEILEKIVKKLPLALKMLCLICICYVRTCHLYTWDFHINKYSVAPFKRGHHCHQLLLAEKVEKLTFSSSKNKLL